MDPTRAFVRSVKRVVVKVVHINIHNKNNIISVLFCSVFDPKLQRFFSVKKKNKTI
jgi:hypothetical protein